MKVLKMFLVACIMSIGLFSNVFADSPGISEKEAQEKASMLYDEVLNSFPESRKDGEKIYPDNYGGSFIDEKGNLNIYKKDIELSLDVEVDENEVTYLSCDYSYNELQEEMEKIKSFCISNKEDSLTKAITQYGIYDEENLVKVFVNEYNEEIENDFRNKISNSRAVVLEEGNKVHTTASVTAGSKVGISGSDYGSVGYRVKKGSQVGFITAGHVAYQGDKLRYNGTGSIIAECVDSVFCDADFDLK